jgi:hypothetical protein
VAALEKAEMGKAENGNKACASGYSFLCWYFRFLFPLSAFIFYQFSNTLGKSGNAEIGKRK